MVEYESVRLEHWSGHSDVVHPVDRNYKPWPAKSYKDERPGDTDRQRAFLRNLARIAIALRSPEVPVVLTAHDGDQYYLDRGCTKVASEQGYLDALEDDGEVVSTLYLQASTGTPHRDPFRPRWRDVGLTNEECSAVEALIFGINESALPNTTGADSTGSVLEPGLPAPVPLAATASGAGPATAEYPLFPEEADSAPFNPENVQDAREKVQREIRARRGQRKFRDALITAYEGCCAISDCDVLDVLEAAHITPYLGPETNHITNGLLLRADLHTLFDTNLLAVDPETLVVEVAPSISDEAYRALHGKPLRRTLMASDAPSPMALRQHRLDCRW